MKLAQARPIAALSLLASMAAQGPLAPAAIAQTPVAAAPTARAEQTTPATSTAPAAQTTSAANTAAAAQTTLIAQNAWVRATPGADIAAAYLTLRNVSTTAVTVTGVESPIAAHAMIHETKVEGGQSKMRPHEQLRGCTRGNASNSSPADFT